MADEWWNSSARTGDAAACSTAAPVTDEPAVSTTPMSFQPSDLPDPDADAVASSSSSFVLADDGQNMDYWTQDFIGGGRASAVEATTSFNTLLQLQGEAASHRLLLADQAAGPYGDGTAPPQGVSSLYAADNQQYYYYCSSSTSYGGDMAPAAATSTKIPFSKLLLNSAAPPSPAAPQQFAGRFLGSSSELTGQATVTEPPEFLILKAVEPKYLKSNTERLPDQDACSPATKSAPVSSAAAKKPRIETPSPLPAFKVRKEKLGDRVTALQQLVSPFGKTDTASVLHEAIEYIKFLHDQVASLSSPYLRSCGRPMQPHHQKDPQNAKDNGEEKQDLRSRGLCLVSVASIYTVASEMTPEFWHPTFGGTFR